MRRAGLNNLDDDLGEAHIDVAAQLLRDANKKRPKPVLLDLDEQSGSEDEDEDEDDHGSSGSGGDDGSDAISGDDSDGGDDSGEGTGSVPPGKGTKKSWWRRGSQGVGRKAQRRQAQLQLEGASEPVFGY